MKNTTTTVELVEVTKGRDWTTPAGDWFVTRTPSGYSFWPVDPRNPDSGPCFEAKTLKGVKSEIARLYHRYTRIPE